MHEIERRILLKLPSVFGVDLSITNEVVLLWLAAVLTFGILWLACRRRGAVARGWFQNLFEALIEFVETEIVKQGVGVEGRSWATFLLTLFFFILFSNLIGLAPFPHHAKAATSSISVTLGLAGIVFVLTVAINLYRHGLVGFLKKFLPAGVPKAAAVIVVPIEIISWLAKPLSLAIRLFANMLVGHALIFVFIGLQMTVAWFLIPLPLVGAVVMSCFEIFVSFIQAFIFTLLAAMYIRDALESTEDG